MGRGGITRLVNNGTCRGEWSVSCLGPFTTWETAPGAHWYVRVEHRTGSPSVTFSNMKRQMVG